VTAGRGRRLLGAAALTAAGTVVAVAAAVLVTRDRAGAPAVVVADDRGREVASPPLPPAGRSVLRYRHPVDRPR
jgi:hypothetical protein